MAYAILNLGRKYTSSKTVECILSKKGIAGTTTYSYSVNGGPTVGPIPFAPYALITLTNTIGTQTVDFTITDGVTPFNITQEIELIDETLPYMPWVPETQYICNYLPEWHPGRRLRTSNWQTWINSVVGNPLNNLSDIIIDSDNAKFLSRCPVNEMDLVGRVWVDQVKLRTPKDPNKNLINNPTLEMLRDPFGNPESWFLSGTDPVAANRWSLESTPTLYGRTTLRCSPDDGERSTAIQAVPINLRSGQSVTATVYYRTGLTGSTTPSNSVDFAVQVVLLYEDGTSAVSSTTLHPETSGRWFTSKVTATASQTVTKAFVIVNLDGITTLSPFDFYLGAVTFNLGEKANQFSFGTTSHFNTVEPYVPDLEPSQSVWLTSSELDFWREAIPTRIGDVQTGTADTYVADATPSVGFYIPDALKQNHGIGFLANTNKIGMYHVESNSLLKLYSLAFFDHGSGNYIPNEGFIVEATAFADNKLWAVGYFDQQADFDASKVLESYKGNLYVDGSDRLRVLCLVKHFMPADPTDYLEVIASYPLDYTSNIIKLEFTNSDKQWVTFYTATDSFHARLYYDYGLVKGDGSVWLREPDSNVSLR